MDVLRMFDPVTLQRAEVVPVTQLGEEVLENLPVPVPAGRSELALEVGSNIVLDAIVIEESVIDVDQEDDSVHCVHTRALPCKLMTHDLLPSRSPAGGPLACWSRSLFISPPISCFSARA